MIGYILSKFSERRRNLFTVVFRIPVLHAQIKHFVLMGFVSLGALAGFEYEAQKERAIVTCAHAPECRMK
jgi:hypothetical protein